MNTDKLLDQIKSGEKLSFRQQILLIIKLSIPAIFAQVSSILMEYIDASMVGRLGEKSSAAIGLVSTSTWLLGGITHAVAIGFTVQIAHFIGAKDEKGARRIVRQAMIVALVISLMLMLIAGIISPHLPIWLGGEQAIWKEASTYFLVYALTIPVYQFSYLSSGMLQCSGNMKLPSIMHIVTCLLDVVFNFFLIFPSREISILGNNVYVPGLGLGVMGAALGTSISVLLIAIVMIYYVLFRSKILALRRDERLEFNKEDLKKALHIGIPVALEQFIMSGAYIGSTLIIAPLGSVAVAAHSFAITAESLCYMPGYGVSQAATTVIGQSIGAGRKELARRLGWISVGLGMIMMAASGALMYGIAPFMMGLLTPVAAISALGTAVLRIEVIAEPLYGASIVASGVFRGAGDTTGPCVLNFLSVWLVRLPLSAVLAKTMGLQGVWLAMCIELSVRGILFLIRLKINKKIR